MPDKFLDVDSGGRKILKTPISTSSGSSDAYKIPCTGPDGKLSETFIPTSLTAESFTAIAGESIVANDLVYTYLEGGILKCKKAIATSETTLAIGFAKNSGGTGQEITIYTDGYITTSGLSLSTRDVFLSSTQAGAWTQTPPSSPGQIIQIVGKVLSNTTFSFELGDTIRL